MPRFLIGLAGGLVLGYTAVRAREAWQESRAPSPPLGADPVAYGRLRRGLMLSGMVRSLATLATLAFAVAPAIEPSDGRPEGRARRIALTGTALALTSLLDVPADYVEGIALERRYGLSKQSDADWLADRAKSTAVSLAIGLPLLELLATAIERAPRSWPFIATAAGVPLLIAANVVAPTYIAPLFNRFEPLEGDFEREIRSLAERYGAGDATVLRVDMSRQTEKANAYVTGLFGTKRIVIGDTLLGNFAPAETLFVVAHELGHYVNRDVWRGVALGTGAAALVFLGGRAMAERPGRSLASTAGLARLFFAFSVLGTLAGPPLAAYSRSRERAADTFALEATSDGKAGAAAFRRLRERNLAEDEQPKWAEFLFSSHPSLRSRIARLESSASR